MSTSGPAATLPPEGLGTALRTGLPRAGIWTSAAELASLPMSGPAWDQMKARADGDPGPPDIKDPHSGHDVSALAVALVFARTKDERYATKAENAVMSAVGTEEGGSALALARNLVGYVVAADLVGLSEFNDSKFRTWLRRLLDEKMSDGKTLRDVDEKRPNNNGTHAGASRAAIAVYLEDNAELDTTAVVFKGWLGDRSSWSQFTFGENSWQCDPATPVALNPKGCAKDGHSIDGVLPDDQRRGGKFIWPPPKNNYPYEALQGALVQAEILARAGYPAWSWQDNALLRAFTWLNQVDSSPATGDDAWQAWLINARYKASFATDPHPRPGKNMAFTEWTLGS